MRLRTLRVPFRVGTEHLIGDLLLSVWHRIVQGLEHRHQLLHTLGMFFGKLLVGLHVLDGGHRLELLSALYEGLIHVPRVLAHHLGKLVPLRLFRRGDAQLRVQLFDPALDPLFGILDGHRVAGQRGSCGRRRGRRDPLRRGGLGRLREGSTGQTKRAATATEARRSDMIIFIECLRLQAVRHSIAVIHGRRRRRVVARGRRVVGRGRPVIRRRRRIIATTRRDCGTDAKAD